MSERRTLLQNILHRLGLPVVPVLMLCSAVSCRSQESAVAPSADGNVRQREETDHLSDHAGSPPPEPADLAWPEAGATQKPWTRWWWPGSAVDEKGLTEELEQMARSGYGGVEITPIYGVKGEESRFVPFLSPRYMELLRHAATEAHRLGLGVDMATGTGWPFGGPWVQPADAELKFEVKSGHILTSPTQFQVKRAAPVDEGPVLDPYSAGAMQRYLVRFDEAFAGFPAGLLRAQFHDSFEYQATWSTELPARFQARRGYDLATQAAALGGEGDPDVVSRVTADYRRTLGELHLDYMRAWMAWAHARGELARNQAHGAPSNLLDLYGLADIPETEVFGSHEFPIPGFRREAREVHQAGPPPELNRLTSSAAHVMGRRLASAETFTWLREHFHEAPSEMKPEVDQLFLSGINHLFYHGLAYSPGDAAWPGWAFYASTQLNPRNPLWREVGTLNAYVTRCQSWLQYGEPDNDLLVYWPAHDLWHTPKGLGEDMPVNHAWLENSFGATVAELTRLGWAHDFVSDAQLAEIRWQDGRLAAPGASYRAVVVPRTAHLPVATLRDLRRLADAGAPVFFVDALPDDVEGFDPDRIRRTQLHAEVDRIPFAPAGPGLRSAAVGQGRMWVGPLRAMLEAAGLPRETLVDSGLRFLRRRTASGDVYFIANLSGAAFDGWLPLAHSVRSAVLLDPLTGASGIAAQRGAEAQPEVRLQLAPGESIFVRTFRGHRVEGTTWRYFRAKGTPVALEGAWRLKFLAGGPELPAPRVMPRLHSWTEDADPAAQSFGGTAQYEITFDLPAGAAADEWLLDLGDVRETAEVRVNGATVGTLWSLPMRTKIGQYLKPGKNSLEIEVTNLPANRIRDLDRRRIPWKKFYDINFVDIHYQPFDASGWPLQPSGLLGPVLLQPLVQTP